MNNRSSLYIVKYYDMDIEEWSEFEHGSSANAKDTYNSLDGQSGVENLHILEYDCNSKKYHFVDVE